MYSVQWWVVLTGVVMVVYVKEGNYDYTEKSTISIFYVQHNSLQFFSFRLCDFKCIVRDCIAKSHLWQPADCGVDIMLSHFRLAGWGRLHSQSQLALLFLCWTANHHLTSLTERELLANPPLKALLSPSNHLWECLATALSKDSAPSLWWWVTCCLKIFQLKFTK